MGLFWLSFVDPESGESRGACVVEVGPDDLREARTRLALDFPEAGPGAEEVVAAVTVARRRGCNPGGEVACVGPLTPKQIAGLPPVERFRLYSRAEIEALDQPAPPSSKPPKHRRR